MLESRRCFYAAFMAHLAVEKALKGLLQARRHEMPPKVHNLVYLALQCDLSVPEGLDGVLTRLNETHPATRYPEDLEQVQRDYTPDVSAELIRDARRVLVWIRTQF